MVNNAITRTPQEQLIRENEKLEKIISIYRELTGKQKAENDKLGEELKEKEVFIKDLETKLQQVELMEKTHIEAFEVSERWNKGQKAELRKEVADKLEMLQVARRELEGEKSKNKELQKQAEENLEALKINHKEIEEQKQRNRELQSSLYLFDKPLPKRPNKLKILKGKIKSKFQKFQLLMKNKQSREQEMIAKIEVKTK